MKRILIIPFMVLVFFTSFIFAGINYSSIEKWKPYHNTSRGTISSVTAQYNYYHTNAIKFDGDGIKSGYILGAWEGLDGAWNHQDGKNIYWEMSYNEVYVIYIRIMTEDGARYLYYTAKDKDLGKTAHTFIHHGLGSDSKDGNWHRFNRNLEKDLQDFEPNNKLVAVNAFLVYGSGLISYVSMESLFIGENKIQIETLTDNFANITWYSYSDVYLEYGKDTNYGEKVYSNYFNWDDSNKQSARIYDLEPNTTYHYRFGRENQVSKDYTFTTLKYEDKIVYEDAEDGDIEGWRHKSGENLIENISEQGNRFIGFLGQIVLGGFCEHPNAWHNTTHKKISWRIRTYGYRGGGFVVNIKVLTKKGTRYLSYTPVDRDNGINPQFTHLIHHGLGSDSKDDNWHTFTRDLESDLKDFEPNNELLEVNGFFVTNTNSQLIYIDDIIMMKKSEESLFDNIAPINISKTHVTFKIDKRKLPQVVIEYGETIDYGKIEEEPYSRDKNITTYYLSSLRPNTLYHYRIVYADGASEDRTFTTLEEKDITYFEANGIDLGNWRIYGNNQNTGTMIPHRSNIKQNSSIEFKGDGVQTGYILGALENDIRAWNDTNNSIISFNIAYSKPLMIYVRIMTKNGARFLYYTLDDKPLGINSQNPTYIHYKLDYELSIYENDWERNTEFRINIKDDLNKYEPDNELLAINGIIFYGDGYVHQVKTISKE